MDEEKRIITIYKDIDYDDSIEKLKSQLEKFDASLKAANEDELQIEIAKSQLEDLCNELDLDIDDMTEEWDSYKPEESTPDEAKPQSSIETYVGKIDKDFDEFDMNGFLENARQNEKDAAVRLKQCESAYELYVDFEDDDAYVEFWKLDLANDAESEHCESKLLFEKEFDAKDISSWQEIKDKLSKWFEKKSKPHHHRHHQQDAFHHSSFSAEGAMLIDMAEEADSIDEANRTASLTEAAYIHHDIADDEYAQIMRILAYKQTQFDKPAAYDAEYQYDEKLAKQILDEILEGANADVPQHIDYAISSRGGEVESMRVAPDSIHVWWHLKGFTADNRIYLNNLDKDIWRLSEDIAHALYKTSAKDSFDRFASVRESISKTYSNETLQKLKDLIDKSTDLTDAEKRRLNLIVAYQSRLIEDKAFMSLKSDIARDYYRRIMSSIDLYATDELRSEIDADDNLTDEESKLLLESLDKQEQMIQKHAFDSTDKQHVVNIKNADMKSIASLCDLFDDMEIKYKLTNDALTIFCGPSQWKELSNRFSILKGE